MLRVVHKYVFLFQFLLFSTVIFSQSAITGKVTDENGALSFATVYILETKQSTLANENGFFEFDTLAIGTYTLQASMTGYNDVELPFEITENTQNPFFELQLTPTNITLDQIVITGTKTAKRQTESAVIVNVVNQQTLQNVQACNLSDGLKFQPGLRVETDCQTCNYTQLRMNGLAGGYSQILINGRPIFSPLTGLYGMEQIPANMIDKIEVVRGGGSALYGSSAIGGTVNILTKIPQENSYQLGYAFQAINSQSTDQIIVGNASVVNHKKNGGMSFFVNHRTRDWYDHNGDNFSELPQIENTSFGTNAFFQPTKNQKLEVSLSLLNEFRYGGEMVQKPAYLTQQSEERTHQVGMMSVDYQINFNNDSSSLITYVAGQNTDRKHYTGILPDDSASIKNHFNHPPYGISKNYTFQGGTQFNHKLALYAGLPTVITGGVEFVIDDMVDQIESYNYLIDQKTENIGAFAQLDWQALTNFNILLGARADKHNFVDHAIFSPRVSLLYKWRKNTQFRATWGTGFRAPQAFDADLHIAFAGGGVSRVQLSPNLKEERSQSVNASINYDLPKEKYIIGFTLEGFHTYLKDAFFLQPIGQDAFGEVFEKTNGQGATVQGATLELRANYNMQVQLEAGWTLQSSQFDTAVEIIQGIAPKSQFMRTPNSYGYATLSITPTPKYAININGVFTGAMLVPHFAGAPNQQVDEIYTSSSFQNYSIKIARTLLLKSVNSKLQVYAGVKNIFNAYQNDFDTGKNRDSNFIYGPSSPRLFYFGFSLTSS